MKSGQSTVAAATAALLAGISAPALAQSQTPPLTVITADPQPAPASGSPSVAQASVAPEDSAAAQTSTAPTSDSAVNNGFGDIIVTARRVSESAQRVPVSITALSAKTLESNNIIQVEEIQRVTPGLQVNATTRGSSTPGFALRGQRAYNVNLLTDPAVSVYFADVGQARTTGTNQTLFDLDSVQVLKGPQGTLFGRNTTGGAILINPKRPTADFGGYIQGALGNYNFHDLEGALNLPLAPTLALRVSGKISKRDGYFKNVLNGQKAQDLDAQSVRGFLAWNPTSNLRMDLLGTYFHSNEVGTAAKLKFYDPRGIPAAFPAATRDALAAIYAGELAATNALGRLEYRNSIPFKTRAKVTGIQHTTSLDIDSGLDSLTVKNIFGYRDIKSRYNADTDGGGISVIDYRGIMNEHQVSDELQLVGAGKNFDFIVGLFYFREKGQDTLDQFPQFDVLTPAALKPTPVTLQDFDGINTSYSAFAHGTLKLGGLVEGLSISGGLRQTWDKRAVTWHNRNEIRSPAGTNNRAFQCLLTTVIYATSDRNLCSDSAKTDFSKLTYDISLNYQASRDVLVYLAHRRGYRSGGFNTSPNNAVQTAPFAPETVNDVELGLKSQFLVPFPVRFNGALFYSKYSDVQRLTSTVIGTRLSSQIVNAAKATIKGLEVDLSLRPARWLDVTLGYSLIDAKYDRWEDTYNVAGVPTTVDISDSGFTYIPRHQLNATATVNLPVGPGNGDLSVQGGIYYQSITDTLENNTRNCGPNGLYTGCLNEPTKLDGYSTFNARINWNEVMGSRVDLSLFANNLTNTHYENIGFALVGAIGTFATAPGAPRMYGLQLRLPFGK